MRRLLIALFALSATFGLRQVQAQSALQPFQPASGSIGVGETDTWTFPGINGQVISLWARSGGALDPVIRLLNSAGEVVLSNDDYGYPAQRDALLQAVTLPRTDTYTVEVSGFGGSSGAYTLTLADGYPYPVALEDFDAPGGWISLPDDLLTIQDGMLMLTADGARVRTLAVDDTVELADFSIAADVLGVSNSYGWSAGLTLRQSDAGAYVVEINNEGLWRFVLAGPDGDQTLVDWRAHPAIRAGADSFSLMAMARGDSFEFFYDGAYIGGAVDDTLTGTGRLGVSAGTRSELASQTQARFDSVRVATPVLLNAGWVLPDELIVSDGPTMAQALVRRHIAGAGGAMALTVPQASVTYARAGVNPLLLGQGTTYGSFALGGTVEIQSPGSPIAACGLIFRSDGGDSYGVLYLDDTGGYGMSERSGDDFSPGVFGESESFATAETHHLLVLAEGATAYGYIDGVSIGQIPLTSAEGQVGIAALNFEPADTTCQYQNIWLWNWGE